MGGFQDLLYGFSLLMNAESLLFCLLGIVAGIIVGALPGMGADAGVAILLPLCYGMKPTTALIMLCSLYYGSMFGGAITSILLNVPGTSAAVVTAYEGHKLARKGQGGKALGMATISSFTGGVIGTLGLAFFAPQLAKQAIKFGPAEMCTMILLAFLMVSGLSNDSKPKSYASLIIGLLLSVVGLDSLSGKTRLTFGNIFLYDGLSSVVVILGFFALTEIMSRPAALSEVGEVRKEDAGNLLPTLAELKVRIPALVRGTLLGFVTGVMPGAGGTTATFLSYGVEKKFTKFPEDIDRGSMDAVVGAESANNACAAGAIVPLMSLSIPGSATAAILLSGFIMFGLQPGPQLFTKSPETAWAIIAALFLACFFLLFVNLAGVRLFVFLVKKAMPFVVPLIACALIAGVYSLNQAIKDIWIMLACGILAYLMIKLKFPLVPALLGLVLGESVESNLRRALAISRGSISIFVTKPICLVFILVGLSIVIVPAIMKKRNKTTPK